MELHRKYENFEIAGRLDRPARPTHGKTDAATAIETAAAPDINEYNTAAKGLLVAAVVFVLVNLVFVAAVSWLNVKTLDLSLLQILIIVTFTHVMYGLLVHWSLEHGLSRRWAAMSAYLGGCLILVAIFSYIAYIRFDNTGDGIKSALGWALDVLFPILPALFTAMSARRKEMARFAYGHAEESVRNVLTAAPDRQLARYDDVLARTRDKIRKLRENTNHDKTKAEKLEEFADRMMVVHPEEAYPTA